MKLRAPDNYASQLAAEARRAEQLHGPWADAHHGFAILKEELSRHK